MEPRPGEINKTPELLSQVLAENAKKITTIDAPAVKDFLADLWDLDSIGGVLDREAEIRAYGQNPILLHAIYVEARDAIGKGDMPYVQMSLRLAEVLGLNQPSPDPRRQAIADNLNKWISEYGAAPSGEPPIQIQAETEEAKAQARKRRVSRILGRRARAGKPAEQVAEEVVGPEEVAEEVADQTAEAAPAPPQPAPQPAAAESDLAAPPADLSGRELAEFLAEQVGREPAPSTVPPAPPAKAPELQSPPRYPYPRVGPFIVEKLKSTGKAINAREGGVISGPVSAGEQVVYTEKKEEPEIHQVHPVEFAKLEELEEGAPRIPPAEPGLLNLSPAEIEALASGQPGHRVEEEEREEEIISSDEAYRRIMLFSSYHYYGIPEELAIQFEHAIERENGIFGALEQASNTRDDLMKRFLVPYQIHAAVNGREGPEQKAFAERFMEKIPQDLRETLSKEQDVLSAVEAVHRVDEGAGITAEEIEHREDLTDSEDSAQREYYDLIPQLGNGKPVTLEELKKAFLELRKIQIQQREASNAILEKYIAFWQPYLEASKLIIENGQFKEAPEATQT